jgi:hypothetical protein
MTVDYGPQYAGDVPFTARLRFHQSWYRATVLGVPCGTGPQPQSRGRYGNMLDSTAANAGGNFLTPAIFDVAQRRIAAGSGVEPFRCLHNMLSSQPMCFNLFGPLVSDHALATRLMRAALPGEVGEVSDVRIEYAPSPKAEYLNDRTSFDAFVAYVRPDGEPAFLGIETKLTDTFSEREYDGPTYRRFTECEPSLWRRDAWRHLAHSPWNQLWRNHLLVEALCRHRSPAHGTRGRLVLVHHPGDATISPGVDQYRTFLTSPDDTFSAWPLDWLVDAWDAVAQSEAERRWLADFRLRYVALDRSQEAWEGLR